MGDPLWGGRDCRGREEKPRGGAWGDVHVLNLLSLLSSWGRGPSASAGLGHVVLRGRCERYSEAPRAGPPGRMSP